MLSPSSSAAELIAHLRTLRSEEATSGMRRFGIVLTEARSNGAKLPLTALVDQFYGDVQAMGGNRWDTSSLLARLEK